MMDQMVIWLSHNLFEKTLYNHHEDTKFTKFF
jgi:hypothetical protein